MPKEFTAKRTSRHKARNKAPGKFLVISVLLSKLRRFPTRVFDRLTDITPDKINLYTGVFSI
jgi:hypothetical protein